MLTPAKQKAEMDLQLAKDKFNGVPAIESAERLGLTYGTVRNYRSRPAVKALVEKLKDELIESALPKAVKNIRQAIEAYDKPLERDDTGKPFSDGLQTREHGMNASLRLMEGAGLAPSKAPAIYIQNIDNSVTIMPLVRQLIASKLEETDDEDETIVDL